MNLHVACFLHEAWFTSTRDEFLHDHHGDSGKVYKKSSAKNKFWVERTQGPLHLDEEEAEACCWERKEEEEVRPIHGCYM